MKLKLFFLLNFLVVFGAKAQNYINPMDIPTVLSASFAELRPNHFHGGIDISTPSIGTPVKSVADGYVSRIKVSPYGYGYGLYITHYDGHTTVYGHLSSYAAKIDSVIRKEQYRVQSFDVDFYPEQSLLPVKQGEVVGYSGNTGGSFGPHLHFEVRTKDDVPINPLAYMANSVDDHR
nr:M23 family metallopeptidase [Bacteroidales bacterium]